MKLLQRINADNNGLSLVELIVVVLIMGILTIGLTPQVLKWVNNARKASDLDYMHNLETAVQFALMNADVVSEVNIAIGGGTEDVVLVVDESGTGPADGKDVTHLVMKTAEVLGFSSSDMTGFTGHTTKVDGGVIQIHINSGRAIGTYTVNGSSVDLSNE